MIHLGQAYSIEKLGIFVDKPFHQIRAEGDCCPKSVIVALSGSVDKLSEKADDLRKKSVSSAQNKISRNAIDQNDIDFLCSATGAENQHALIVAMEQLKQKYAYDIPIGDFFLQIISAHLDVVICVINISKMEATSHVLILPEVIFKGSLTNKSNIIVIRANDHFEYLSIPDSSQQKLQKIVSQERINRRKMNLYNKYSTKITNEKNIYSWQSSSKFLVLDMMRKNN